MTRNAFIILLMFLSIGSSLADRKSPFTFGKIGLDQSATKVLRVLGPPTQKSEVSEEMATGEMVQKWAYPDLGLELDMSEAKESKGLTVYRIHAKEPCDMRGYRGVNVGAFAVEIQALARELERYNEIEVSRSDDGYGFLWTEEYQMLSLTFKNGKVSEIFLGPGPE